MFWADAPVTLLLLVVIVLVSGYALYFDPALIDRLGFKPVRVRDEPYRYITAGFVHASLMHLAFNAITLYYFGPNLEMRLGTIGFTVLYFGSMVGAHGLTQAKRKGEGGYNAVGASGAISGVLFGYALFAPTSFIYFFGVLPVPAVIFAILFVVGSMWAMGRGRIAHEAHLGGAFTGLVLTAIMEPRAVTQFLDQLL